MLGREEDLAFLPLYLGFLELWFGLGGGRREGAALRVRNWCLGVPFLFPRMNGEDRDDDGGERSKIGRSNG